MRNFLFPVVIGILCISFTIIPAEPAGKPGDSVAASPTVSTTSTTNTPDAGDALYNRICLQQYGLSRQAFDHAWKGYRYLLEHNKISRSNYLTICDFSQSSRDFMLLPIPISANMVFRSG
ncbi:MAG: hypothetical protein FJY20_06095 [Bacteroidetes bacterium]|nr:hypothetical protein [Bacteroidota bacterium]